MSSIRYSDMSLEENGAIDFVSRQRTPTAAQLAIIFISIFIVCVSIIVSVGSQRALIAILFIVLAMLGWYMIYHLIRSRDIVLATEFQNALFASALGLNNKFNLIIKRDGTIIYLDRSFQAMFPDFTKNSSRTIDMLFKAAKVTKVDADKVSNTIDKGEYGKVLLDITDAHGVAHGIILSVEPILRPPGFTMLRGREYVTERSNKLGGEISETPSLNKSSITLFSPVIESMKMGIYITSPDGQVVYCNTLLEQWLQYDDGEIPGRGLNLNRLFPPARNETFAGKPVDFEGNVQMEKKVGGFITAFLNQKIIYNNVGKPIGCTAIVHLYDDGLPSAKKKSGSPASDEQF